MKVSDVKNVLKKLAPPTLAYEGEETGIIIEGKRDVKVIGVTERPTVWVLKEAVEKKVDFLIIHEPLYQSKKSFLVNASELKYPPNSKREELVNEGGFYIYRCHSEWDEVKDGNNETLAKLLGIEITGNLPFGRLGKVNTTTLRKFAESVKTSLDCPDVLVVGDDNKKINCVAVMAGSGNSLTEIMEVAKKKGADVLVSGDIQDSRARFAQEMDLAIIDAGDYYTENPGARKLADLLKSELPELTVYHLDPGPPWKVL